MRRTWLLGLIALTTSTATLSFGRPPNGAPEPPRIAARQFVPRAGYARTTKVFYLNRLAMRPRNGARAAYDALTGTRNIPVILLSFKNRAAPFPSQQYQSMLFDEPGQPPSLMLPTLSAYYRDVSHGKLQVGGRVFGWYPLPNDDTYYENNDLANDQLRNGDGPPFGELLQFGLEKADAETDFGLYDNDGPDGIPNSGDDDGKVDTVFFIHPEVGAECGGGDARTNIWSHSWHYSEPAFGHNGPFVTRAIRRNKDGTPMLNDDGTPQHIVVEDYTIQPGLACPEDNGGNKMIQVGVFCHEFGHALGLPDLYDRRNKSEGVGNWCLMAGGSYGGDGRNAQCPAAMSAWCQSYLGWSAVETITQDDKKWLEPVEDRGLMYRLNVPNTGRREYFLIEYRDRNWQDTVFRVRQNWDRFLPVSGVAIWHVDERVGEGPAWPFAPLGQGQNDDPSLPNAPAHSLVCLCQTDRSLDLEYHRNRGDGGDLLGNGGKFGDDDQYLFGSRGYDHKPTQIAIASVDLFQRNIEFKSGEQIATGPVNGARAAAGADTVRPPAAPSLSESEHARQSRLTEVAEKLAQGKQLSFHEQRVLDTATATDLHVATPPTLRPTVRAAAAAARTEVFTTGTTPSDKVDPRVATLLRQQAPGSEISVQFGPARERVERISGLNLAKEAASVDANGNLQLQPNLKSLVGDNVSLTAKPETTAASGPTTAPTAQKFWQAAEVAGKRLPVFDTETALYRAADGTIKTVASNTVHLDRIKIVGTPGAITLDQAKQIAAKALGLSEKTIANIKECREGVYLDEHDQAKANVAFRVCIPSAPGQEPIHVFIDADTKQILNIK